MILIIYFTILIGFKLSVNSAIIYINTVNFNFKSIIISYICDIMNKIYWIKKLNLEEGHNL